MLPERDWLILRFKTHILIFILNLIIFGSVNAEAPTIDLPEESGCEFYKDLIRQYDWNDELAIQIMMAESQCNPKAVNDNPKTKDYSVGLFQINLYGSNAKHRPSEEELKDPRTNIEFAYQLYKDYGFNSQWGVCRRSVKCYN